MDPNILNMYLRRSIRALNIQSKLFSNFYRKTLPALYLLKITNTKTSVSDPDPFHFGQPDPDPLQ